MWWSTICLTVLAISGSGFTKQPASASGISQFWTDDYKVFDQIYGKTSDKDLFGATLPPSVAYGIDGAKLKFAASEKKERFLENHQTHYSEDDQDSYNYGTRYPSLTNQALFNPEKPLKNLNLNKFIPSDFKPIITKNNDPETYEYLKHLELLQKKKKFLLQNAGGFKPYLSYAPENTEETEGYRSIQDILEAHEANQGKPAGDDTDDQVKYLNHGPPKPRGPNKKFKPTVPLNKGKPRCPGGRCRKRATTTYRGRTYLTRPMIRKIKKVVYH